MSVASLRRVVLVLAVAETAILLAFLLIMMSGANTSDPIGRSIGLGMAQLVAIPIAALVIPAFFLGYFNRWTPVALAMLALAAPLSFLLWYFA